jgi:hypothetical protein
MTTWHDTIQHEPTHKWSMDLTQIRRRKMTPFVHVYAKYHGKTLSINLEGAPGSSICRERPYFTNISLRYLSTTPITVFLLQILGATSAANQVFHSKNGL